MRPTWAAGQCRFLRICLSAARPTDPPALSFDGRAWNAAWLVTCEGGLEGATILIDGLDRTSTDTLVRYEAFPGSVAVQRLTPGQPAFTIAPDAGALAIFTSYVALGVTHILEGLDHLLFVFALLLLTRGSRSLIWAVTAFTLAHSITLAGSTFGWLALPSAPVEVVIALSIVFLAYELALPPDRRDPLTDRFPAIVAFGFGLIHGMGFAGALREIGLPQGDVPLALLAFNVGVEIGQLAFIAIVVLLWLVVRGIVPAIAGQTRALTLASSYCIGTISTFWVIQRFAGL